MANHSTLCESLLVPAPLLQHANYDLTILDARLDIQGFLARNRIAEVGRFAVLAAHRGNLLPAVALMRAAMEEILNRGYTHIITDVFEDDAHSSLGFHTRVIGFVLIATHKHAELNCQSRRITLLLDLKSSYHRLKARGNWVYRHLTANCPPPCTVALPRDCSANRRGQHEIASRRHGARPERQTGRTGPRRTDALACRVRSWTYGSRP
jgi:hypothetical protein